MRRGPVVSVGHQHARRERRHTMTTIVAQNIKKTEWVAVLHGGTGTVKIAYRSPDLLARGLEEQTKEGWMVARVYERERQTYSAED